MSACVAVADWTIFYIFNRNGLSTNIIALVPSLIILPYAGFFLNLALLIQVIRVIYAYLATIMVHGQLLYDGWTGFTAISEEVSAICDDKLLVISLIYVGINLSCFFDAFVTRFFAIVNDMFRPHPRAQG